MAKKYSPLSQKFRKTAIVLCFLVIAISISVLIEWVWWEDIQIYRKIISGGLTMNPTVAILLLFLSTATLLRFHENHRKLRFYSTLLCCIVLLVCVLKLIALAFDLPIHPDRILFKDYIYLPGIGWSGLYIPAIICLSFFSLAIIFIDFELKDGFVPAQFLIFFNIFIVLVQMYSWTYKILSVLILLKVAINTSISFFLLSFAILFIRPDRGTTKDLIGTFSIENTILRILAMIIPLLLGWLKLTAEAIGYIDKEMGTALFAISTFLISVALLSRNAVLQENSRKAKILAAEKIKENEDRLKLVLSNISEGAGVANIKGEFIFSNHVSQNLFGNEAWFIPKKDKDKKYHYYYLDGKTKVKPSKLPIFRAIIGETVDAMELIVKNHDYPEGIALRVKAMPLKNKDGKIEEGITIFRDISYRASVENLLREEEKRLISILMSLNEGVIIVDQNREVSFSNPKAEELIGKPIDPSVNEEDWPKHYSLYSQERELLTSKELPFFHQYEAKGIFYVKKGADNNELQRIKFKRILVQDNYEVVIAVATILSE